MMRTTWMVSLVAVAMLPPLVAQSSKTADWPTYKGNLAGTGYSPLTQINTKNAARLVQAWSYGMPSDSPGGSGGYTEVTPIVVGGVMYLYAEDRVVALDGESGKEIWRHEFKSAGPTRGVAYWPGDSETSPRIMFISGSRLISLNANTGKLDPGFGKEGVVDIDVRYGGVPTIYKNVVLVGAQNGEVPIGPPGDTRAYDARTGKKLWEFHSVPRPGEPGFGTWEGDSWKGRAGVNVWGWYMTVDEERGIVYMPFGGAAANYYGGDRHGANLFANSLVAVDALTGKYKWHFQMVHHGLWDSDLPPAPGLVDIVQNGKTIPALALIGKTGYMFFLNRVTGEPVYGVEERPVPKGDVPGEYYHPTQPFPLKPPPLARVSFDVNDIVTADDTTPEHAKACREEYERNGDFYNAGPFTPFRFHEEGAPPRSTIQFPGGTGGANWGGTATDLKTGYVFVNTHDSALTGWLEKKKPGANYGRGTEGSDQPYDRGSVDGPGPYHGFSALAKDENGRTLGNWPCQKPPWGRLSAVNANTGEIVWQVPLGITEALPAAKQNTGGSGPAGPIVTAGGLVFIGATNDNRFRAFDAMTGRELWAVRLDRSASANPMTYQAKNGKQYLAVVAAGGRGSKGTQPSLVVFSLP
jgi:glucose dehydrogenase